MKKIFLVVFFSLAVMSLSSIDINAMSNKNNEFITSFGFYLEPKIAGSIMMGNYLNKTNLSQSSSFDLNSSFGGGMALGYDFQSYFKVPMRMEAEYLIRTTTHFNKDSYDVSLVAPQTLFVNLYYDFENESNFTPYIGGGIGAAFVGVDSNFAWNVGAGLTYDISECVALNLGYRYNSYGQFENNNTTGILSAHEVLAGLRYKF